MSQLQRENMVRGVDYDWRTACPHCGKFITFKDEEVMIHVENWKFDYQYIVCCECRKRIKLP